MHCKPGTASCWQTWHNSTVQRLHHMQTRSHGAEGWRDTSVDNKLKIVQSATFYKSLNPRNIDKNVSDIRIRIRFPFESSFWVSFSGWKLTILPDVQPANHIVTISAGCQRWGDGEIFHSESSPDPIKLNPIQSWSAHVKSCIFISILELFCL